MKKCMTIISAVLLAAALAFMFIATPTGAVAAGEAGKDETLATTYQAKTGLVMPPTVVFDVDSKEDVDLLPASGDRSPSNAILHIDGNCNVVDGKGKVIDSFANVYAKLDHKVIPVVSISDDAGADAFISYMTDALAITDIAVHSEKVELVSKVRTALPEIRGIAEYTEMPDELYTVVKDSTTAGAMVVVIPESAANAETVNYLQARFKTVWVRSDTSSVGDIRSCLYSGGYGIVTEDYGAAYDCLEDIPSDVYTRNIFNVAHRGQQSDHPENSLSAVEAAMRSGVTHLELDGHLTKDKRIVIMHDKTVDATTNGSGTISNMTLAEVQALTLKNSDPYNPEHAPSFEDVIDLINDLNEELGTDVVLVFEIKDSQTDFVEYMKQVIEEKDFYEHIVIITFDGTEHQLAALHEQVPQIPVSDLDGYNVDTFGGGMPTLNQYNSGTDIYYNSNYSEEFADMLVDRGYMPWFWTYGTKNEIYNAAKIGVQGVTNNTCECYGDEIYYIFRDDIKNADKKNVPEAGDALKMYAVNYRLYYDNIECTVTDVTETDKCWKVFVSYTYTDGSDNERTIYAAVNYLKPVSSFPAWAIAVICVGAAVIIGAGITAIVIVKRRKAKS